MKNGRILLLMAIILVTGGLSVSKAQDAFFLNDKVYRFEPIRQSNYFIHNNEVRLHLYGEDRDHRGKFTIPMDLMYRYVYKDSTSVVGSLDNVVMARPEDFAYVSEICLKAQYDCRHHYKTWVGSMCGTLVLTTLNPLLGLAVAIPASTTTPRIENLGLTDVDMLQEDIYFHVYRKEAKRLKSKRNWMAYGIGLGIHVGIVFGIVAACQ